MASVPDIKVTFHVHFNTTIGQTVSITGSLPSFGEWEPKSSIRMEYKEIGDTNWRAIVSVPKNTFLEYKYVVVDDVGTALRWEPRPNRELQLGGHDFSTIDLWGIEDYEEEATRNEEMRTKIFEEELLELERERQKKIEDMKKKMNIDSKKKDEVKQKGEEERQEEERQAKKREIEEERLKMEEERNQKLEELRVKEEERKKQLEDERRKIEEEREKVRIERTKRMEEKRKKMEEDKRKKEEEEIRKKEEAEEEEERKKEEEEERKRKEEADRRRKEEEEEMRKKEEEERERKKKEEEDKEKKRKEEEERKREEEERRRKEEEAKKKKEKKGFFDFDFSSKHKKKEEEEKKKKEEEEKRKAEEKKKEEEKKRKESEATSSSSWAPTAKEDPVKNLQAQRELRRKKEEEEAKKAEEERIMRQREREAKANERKKKRDAAKTETEQLLKEIDEKRKEEERKVAELKRIEEEKRKEEERLRQVEEQRQEEIRQEQLVYVTGDRVMKDVPFPAVNRLVKEKLFDANGKPYVDWLRDHFLREGRLTPDAAKALILQATEIMKEEPNLIELVGEVTIIGDTHGQFYDLVKILELGGPAWQTQYLFLGDYVDRGLFSAEICFLIFAMKIVYPKNVYLLRGNHECRGITAHYNFKTECLHKYDNEIYDLFMEAFDAMPLAATIESKVLGKFFCAHAGIGPGVKTLDDVTKIPRIGEPPDKGPFCDLMWADPVEDVTSEGLSETELQDWFKINFKANGTRGCSYVYGYNAINQFLLRNKMVCLIRSHEVQKYGYLEHRFRKDRDLPLVITVFSAPNYCDKYENFGAFMKITDSEYRFQMLTWAEHPYYLPHFIDVFTFTLPFIAENMAKFYLHLLDTLLLNGSIFDNDPEDKATFDEFKKKMQTKSQELAKTMLFMRTLRMNNEATVQPFASKYEKNKSMFEKAVREDQNNELRPLSSSDRSALTRNKSTPTIRQQTQTRRPVMPQRQATFHVKKKGI